MGRYPATMAFKGSPFASPGHLVPTLDQLSERAFAGLCRQFFFRLEVGVEAAVRQPGALHQAVDADAVEALFPKQSARNIENPLAILLCLLPGDLHGLTRSII